jgi:hypothetical protein
MLPDTYSDEGTKNYTNNRINTLNYIFGDEEVTPFDIKPRKLITSNTPPTAASTPTSPTSTTLNTTTSSSSTPINITTGSPTGTTTSTPTSTPTSTTTSSSFNPASNSNTLSPEREE